HFQRGQFTYAFSLRRPKRGAVLFSIESHPGAGLLCDPSWRCASPLYLADVRAVALVRRTHPAVRSQEAPDHRPSGFSRWIRTVCAARHWWFLLDYVLSSGGSAWVRYG